MMFICRLDEAIKLGGMERKDFALLAGISVDTINDYCIVRRKPSVDKAIRIAQYLDTTVEDIWYFDD